MSEQMLKALTDHNCLEQKLEQLESERENLDALIAKRDEVDRKISAVRDQINDNLNGNILILAMNEYGWPGDER